MIESTLTNSRNFGAVLLKKAKKICDSVPLSNHLFILLILK